MSDVPCVCCGGVSSRPYVAGLRQCIQCTHVWADPGLSENDATRLYAQDYFQGGEYVDYEREAPALRRNFRRRLRDLVRRHPQGGFLWEIGAAYGYFLKEASSHFTVAGCDVSDFAAAYARTALSLDVQAGDYLRLTVPRPCDVICLWDTIEHLSDPRAYLAKARDDLRPAGTLALSTGDIGSAYARWRGAKWRLIHPPTHLHYFTRASITTLLTNLGFEDIRVSYESIARSADNVAYRFLVRLGGNWGHGQDVHGTPSRRLLARLGGNWGKRMHDRLRRIGALNFTFCVNLRDIMVVYAQNGSR